MLQYFSEATYSLPLPLLLLLLLLLGKPTDRRWSTRSPVSTPHRYLMIPEVKLSTSSSPPLLSGSGSCSYIVCPHFSTVRSGASRKKTGKTLQLRKRNMHMTPCMQLCIHTCMYSCMYACMHANLSRPRQTGAACEPVAATRVSKGNRTFVFGFVHLH